MTAIKNGRIVTPQGIIEDKTLIIEGDRIVGLTEPDKINAYGFCLGADDVVDARGRLVTPGFIDIHSDKIEQFIQPRPTAQMELGASLRECERDLLQLGITTIYHSLSLWNNDYFDLPPVRSKENVLKLASMIDEIHQRRHLIRHRLHLRLEIDNFDGYDIVSDMVHKKKVHEISFMDHSPGQGQYRNLEIYKKSVTRRGAKSIEAEGIENIVELHRRRPVIQFEKLAQLAREAHENGIAVASHDDDTEEKLEVNNDLGVDISEFPVTLETAKSAKRRGFHTVTGAPNILLGGSHSGNLSASEAILNDCADIICSDYYPPAILQGVFIMNRKYGIPLVDMINRVTLNPARAMRIDGEQGSIEPGKKADILIIGEQDGYPAVTHVFVDGKATFHVEYRI
jgi:Metal-dependent hydrolase involved in phosphonate metabolism